MINENIINECTRKNLSFPEVIRSLSEIGIERYYTDLVRMEKIYYSHSGETFVERMTIDNLPDLALRFDKEKVVAAILASQKGKINYHSFIRNILAAGITSYTVYLDGKQVIYAGRKGESHSESFHF